MKGPGVLLLLALAAPLRAESPVLQVAVDPRTELLTTVQLLSGDVALTPPYYRSPYFYGLYRSFFPFRQHRAVLLLHSLMSKAPWPDLYHYIVLCLSNPPELVWQLPLASSPEEALLGGQMLEDWVGAMRSFADQSQFANFFAQQTPLYYHLIGQVNEKLAGEDLLGPLEAYYGMGLGEYHLVLSPILHQGGFGPRLPLGEGYAGYAIVGPDGMAGTMPTYSLHHLRELVWHEFGHSFVNPLTAGRHEQLQATLDRFIPLVARMEQTGYPTWDSCVNEHLIRAITARLLRRVVGEEAGQQAVQQEVSRGFVYVPALCRRLEEYEAQRGAYPNIAAFLPQLLAVFEEEPEKN